MKKFFPILLFFFLYSCSQKDNDKVFLVFEKPMYSLDYVSNSNFFQRTNSDVGVISYLKKDTVMFYSPQKDFDTLKLNVEKGGVEVVFKESVEPFRYYLMAGDTVLFHLNELGKPILTSKISERNTRFYNLPYQLQTGVKYDKMHPWVGLVCFGYEMERFEMAKRELPSLYERVQKDYVPRDTLVKSIEIYNDNFAKKFADLKKDATFSEDQMQYLYYLKELCENYLSLGKAFAKVEKPKKGSFDNFYNDNYIDFLSYRKFIKSAFGHYYDIAEEIPLLYGGTKRGIDSRETFNKIVKATNIPPLTKKNALNFVLQKIVKQFTEEEAEPYVRKYMKLTEETFFSGENKKVNYAVDELLLEDLSGNQITFEQLQQNHKGKVLYVDFWASWCGPCKYQMLASEKLHKKLEKEDVVFFYFAFRDSKHSWKKACKELGLEENSYFIVNPKTAKIIADYQIRGIPHYLLFDKNGKLVDKNAPQPRQEASEKAIGKYLN